MKEKPIYEQLGYDPDPPFYAPTSTPIVTNYDRIVRKTPEELADYFSELTCFPGANRDICKGVANCMDCWLDWLKQEASE